MKKTTTSLSSHQVADLVLLASLASIIMWYCYDAYQASDHILNLILIVPVSAICLILCAISFVQQITGNSEKPEGLEPVSSVIPVISLFAVYVITLPWLGFDVGTFFFVGLFLIAHGERRPVWVIGYSLVFALAMAQFFSFMLPYPMPMLILPTAY